jgi:hypothetical protein
VLACRRPNGLAPPARLCPAGSSHRHYDFLTKLLAPRYAVSADSEDVRTSRPVGNVVFAFGTAMALIAVLAWTPAFVTFGLAAIAAVCWCIWLERHPAA